MPLATADVPVMPDVMSMPYASGPRPRSNDTIWFVLVALVPFLGLSTALGMWVSNPLRYNPRSVLHVTGTRPMNGTRNVLPNAFVAADIFYKDHPNADSHWGGQVRLRTLFAGGT